MGVSPIPRSSREMTTKVRPYMGHLRAQRLSIPKYSPSRKPSSRRARIRVCRIRVRRGSGRKGSRMRAGLTAVHGAFETRRCGREGWTSSIDEEFEIQCPVCWAAMIVHLGGPGFFICASGYPLDKVTKRPLIPANPGDMTGLGARLHQLALVGRQRTIARQLTFSLRSWHIDGSHNTRGRRRDMSSLVRKRPKWGSECGMANPSMSHHSSPSNSRGSRV